MSVVCIDVVCLVLANEYGPITDKPDWTYVGKLYSVSLYAVRVIEAFC